MTYLLNQASLDYIKDISGHWLSCSSDDIYDDFDEGVAGIKLNNKWNFINTEGEILSEQWFDEVHYFNDNFDKIDWILRIC